MSDRDKIDFLAMLVAAGFIFSDYYFLAAGVAFILVLDLLLKIARKREDFEK